MIGCDPLPGPTATIRHDRKEFTGRTHQMSNHFIGVDAGGTRTRALLATEAGEIIGVGRAAGANSWSSGTSVSAAITTAVRAAISENDPTSVVGGAIAVAGGGASSPQIAAEINESWHSLGVSGSPQLVPDVVAAYAAGTTAPRGLVLAAGTGAISAVIDRGQVLRRAGGHGWMVGDEGSAVWLGRKGAQAALRALDGRGPETVLSTMICEALQVDGTDAVSTASGIVAAVNGRPPAQVGQLAPLVVDACEHGDPVAQGLVEAAADHLADTAAAAMGPERPTVIVLAGSLLTRAAPIKRLVRAELTELWPATPIVETSSGEAGAVALAIARHTGAPLTEAVLTRLRSAIPPGGEPATMTE